MFYVIGIGNRVPFFSEQQRKRISETRFFSGGKRHYELVKSFLPNNYKWFFIKSPLEEVFTSYRKIKEPIIVFASGNPLFYGFTNTLKRKFPKTKIVTEPYFSSIDILATKKNITVNNLITVSVHGRGWKELDVALMQNAPLVGVLTDTIKNPKTIAKRLLAYGYSNYAITIGEDLEGNEEKIRDFNLEEVENYRFHSLNCVLLRKVEERKLDFGIKDIDFKGLEGRPNMITKMSVRLTTLHLLEIFNREVLWDIGFCTGSVSIESKLKNPNLEVIAFEKRLECEMILQENQFRFGVLGITKVMGDFFDKKLEDYIKPDAIFIGGHGGNLQKMMEKINQYSNHNTVIVINAVKEDSVNVFINTAKKIGWKIIDKINLTVNSHNPIHLIKAVK